MYIVSAVLLFPACILLWLGWSHKIKNGPVATESRWREYGMAASLIATSCATLTEIGFVISWFHNGGSPHGMEPSPGLWKTLGPIFRGTLLTSVALAILGKGKPRIYVLRMDSHNPCCNRTDFRIGNGLILRLARRAFR
jgi:hypothetical protein